MLKVLKKYAGKDFSKVLSKDFIVLPSAYLAPISYYYFLNKNKEAIIDIHENFVKRSIRNRAYLLGPNGHILLTVPKRKTMFRSMNKTEIFTINKWTSKHWKAITSCYNSSPYFKYYKDDFENIYSCKHNYLFELNKKLNDLILDILKIKCNCIYSDGYVITQNKEMDFRDHKYLQQYNYSKVFKEYDNKIELSVIDLIFNLGPDSNKYLKSIYI
ncbi:WbqC family protein [Bacteroidota bacterium]|nr:WbqC family protein [Bacteroidota bacterium]MDC3129906.1 WbqC family protein [Bacteroidota bacterium]MDC3154026.1 WbqC family protein [Bacteroidota bacterium]MDC3230102.1 WbqC family protein [Bacteroidota bacterium]